MIFKRIEMTNFVKLKSGLGLNKVSLDLRDGITLFIGENGRGKSTILKHISVLPREGAIDDPIIPDKDGLKIVFFEHEDKEYKAIFEYISKTIKDRKSHSIKAYLFEISPDGKEIDLNPSGLITEYMQRLELMFNVTTSTNRIVSLSEENKGIISMSPTERTDFIYDAFSMKEVEEADDLIRDKISLEKKNKTRLIKNISKMEDPSIILIKIENLKAKRDSINTQIDNLINEEIDTKVKIESLDETINKTDIKSLETKLSLLNKVSNYANLNNLKDDTNIFKFIRTNDNDRLRLENEQSNKRELYFSKIEEQLKYKDVDLNYVEKQIYNLNNKVKNYPKKIKDPEYVVKVDRAYNDLENITPLLDSILGAVTNEFISYTGVIGREVTILENKIIQTRDRIQEINGSISGKTIDQKIINATYPKECTFDSCALKTLYKEAVDDLNNSSILESELRDLSNKLESLEEELVMFRQYKELDDKLDILISLFNSNLISFLNSTKSSLRKDIITKPIMINKLQDRLLLYKGMINDEEKLSELLSEKETLSKEVKEKTMLDKEINLLSNEIDTLEIRIKNIPSIDENILKYTHNTVIELHREKDNIINEIAKCDKMLELRNITNTKLNQIVEQLSILKSKKEDTEELINNHKLSLTNIETWKDELDELNVTLTQLSQVRYIVSKVLPKMLIKDKLLHLQILTNNFSKSFNYDFRITKMNLENKGLTIELSGSMGDRDDVSDLSNGQKSMMSIMSAISIKEVMMPKFSSMKFDEIDGYLDAPNKKRFYALIKHAVDLYGITQVFIITHNEQFRTEADCSIVQLGERCPFDKLKIKPYRIIS